MMYFEYRELPAPKWGFWQLTSDGQPLPIKVSLYPAQRRDFTAFWARPPRANEVNPFMLYKRGYSIERADVERLCKAVRGMDFCTIPGTTLPLSRKATNIVRRMKIEG